MAARKGASAPPAVNTSADVPTLSASLATDPLPTVRVNKSHLAEIKTALDDIVKEVGRGGV